MPPSASTEHLRNVAERPSIAPVTMRVPEACRYLGIGRSTLYVLIGKGEIETIKLGASTLVVTESLQRLVDRRRQGTALPVTSPKD